MSAQLKPLNDHERKVTPTATIVPFKQKTVKQLSPEEKRLVVDVAKDSVTRFDEKARETLILLRSLDAYPRIYGSLSPLTYSHTQLVDLKDIDLDNEYFNQLVRAGVNPKGKNISEDLKENGYSLTELPIMVMKRGDKYFPIDGRTRMNYLIGMGMTNFIVDIFEEADTAALVIFAVYLNNYKKEFGTASYHDLQKAIMTLVDINAIPFEEGSMGVTRMTDKIRDSLSIMSSKLTANQTNDLIHNALEKLIGVRQVISFPQGNGVQTWLDDYGYKNNAEIMYVPFSTSFIGKLHTTMVHKVKDNQSIGEFRMVGYIGVLDAENPAGHWKKNLDFKKNLIKFENDLSSLRFGEKKRLSPKIKVHGLIPQVKELEDKYPMDKLYLFAKDIAEA